MTEPIVKDIASDDAIEFFRVNGYLRIPGVVAADELQRLQEETQALVEYALEKKRRASGYYYAPSTVTDGTILSRIEFVTGRSEACKLLMAHPGLLRMVEKISGRDFIPIGDAMVLKLPGEGAQVPWHRDHGSEWNGPPQNYNVDIYLDNAPQETCLWAIPGSNLWPDERAAPFQQLDCVPSGVADAVPLEMKAGDILLHDARIIHGSPTTSADAIRRTLYYWFYSLAALEPYNGSPGYQPKRWKYLHQCIEARKQSSYAEREAAFDYRAEVPGVTGDEEDVSFVYTDHGQWNPARL